MRGSALCKRNILTYGIPISGTDRTAAERPGSTCPNAAGDTIYVGKARALRDRVRNYLGAYGSSPRTDALLDEIVRLEFIVTDSVVEALALENNLIKQRSPKYNILLRDDKNYPYLQLTTTEAFPRVLVARGVERDGNFYAGPFMPARFARKTMALTHRLFGIRSCNEVITGQRNRPCLEYDIKRCIAPCVASICSPTDYERAVEDTRLFLEGRKELTRSAVSDAQRPLGRAVQSGAVREIRNSFAGIASEDKDVDLNNRDVFGMKTGPAGAAVQVFQVRGGCASSGSIWELKRLSSGATKASAHGSHPAVLRIQNRAVHVHLPMEPEEREALETWLSGEGHNCLVILQRGDKRAWSIRNQTASRISRA